MSLTLPTSFVRPAAGTARPVLARGLLVLTATALLGIATLTPVLAACPPDVEPAIETSHPFGTIRRAPVMVRYPSDPDWLRVLEANAERAVDSGLWEARIRDSIAMLRARAIEPRFPLRRPMTHTAILIEKPTGVDAKTLHAGFPAGSLAGFARTYLLFDETNDVQRRFARQVVATLPAAAGLRPIVTGGSVARARELLATRVWADQGSVLTRRLGLTHWPALVRLTPERLTLWMPALNPEGEPIDPIPPVFTEHLPQPVAVVRPSHTDSEEVRS